MLHVQYQGQLFALLGHNGSGKSTTIGMHCTHTTCVSMLSLVVTETTAARVSLRSGMLTASGRKDSGSATFDGLTLGVNNAAIRDSMGYSTHTHTRTRTGSETLRHSQVNSDYV